MFEQDVGIQTVKTASLLSRSRRCFWDVPHAVQYLHTCPCRLSTEEPEVDQEKCCHLLDQRVYIPP